jgi:hypothetical protein
VFYASIVEIGKQTFDGAWLTQSSFESDRLACYYITINEYFLDTDISWHNTTYKSVLVFLLYFHIEYFYMPVWEYFWMSASSRNKKNRIMLLGCWLICGTFSNKQSYTILYRCSITVLPCTYKLLASPCRILRSTSLLKDAHWTTWNFSSGWRDIVIL